MGTIQVTGIGKAYKQYPTRWARLAEWLLPGERARHQLKWILRDINFIVSPGEAVGIIGLNGAGKSTLLKIITGTTQPTTGSVRIGGRVAALLELGMGFHPDFTGRQNVYMAGQLLGLTAEDITALMPQIEAFADIGDYIHQPLRVYSSGMQMRLAFSLATARRPDVLIVDEALSVGDDYFQHKCFERIRQYREQGTTLLIVSHDKQAIQSICDRALLLNAGHVAMAGEPAAVMDYYNAMLAEREAPTVQQKVLQDGQVQTLSGTGEATVTDVSLLNGNGEPVEVIDVGQPVTLRIGITVRHPLRKLVVGYAIKDRLGQPMFGTNTHLLQCIETDLGAGETLTYSFSFDANLGEGTYSVAVALHESESHSTRNYEWRDLALVFQVMNMTRTRFVGSGFLPPRHAVARNRVVHEEAC